MSASFARGEDPIVGAGHEDFVAGKATVIRVSVDTIIQIDSRWSRLVKESARVQASTQGAVGVPQGSAANPSTDMALALQRVSDMCARVTDQVAAAQLERPALVEAVALLSRSIATQRMRYPSSAREAAIARVDSDECLADLATTTSPDETGRVQRHRGSRALLWATRLRQRTRSDQHVTTESGR
jgi:hypothetical protein